MSPDEFPIEFRDTVVKVRGLSNLYCPACHQDTLHRGHECVHCHLVTEPVVSGYMAKRNGSRRQMNDLEATRAIQIRARRS